MKRRQSNSKQMRKEPSQAFENALLGMCLCMLSLRCTFTESPVSRMSMLSFSLFDLSHSLVVSTVLLLVPGLWLLRGLLRGSLVYKSSGLEFGLGLFTVVAAISLAVAADKRAAVSELVMVISPILMCLLLVQVLDSPWKIRLVLAVIAALGLVTAFECADQFFTTNQATIQQYEEDPQTMLEPMGLETGSLDHFLFEHRLYSRGVNGFFTTRNSAGSFLLMAFVAALALCTETVTVQRKQAVTGVNSLVCIACATAILGALLLTKSKGAIAGCLLLIGGLAAFRRFRPTFRRHGLRLILGGIALAAIGSTVLVCYGLKHGRLPGGNSMLVRWQYWRATGQMIAEHPWLGIGAGNFAHYYHQYKAPEAIESVSDPHNLVLSLWAQYGPLGLIAVFALVVLPLKRLVSAFAVAPSPLSDPGRSSAKRRLYGYVFTISTFMLVVRPLLSSLAFSAPIVVLLTVLIHTLIFSVGLFFLNGLSLENCTGSQTDDPIFGIAPVLFCMVLSIGLANMTDFALFEPGVWTCFWTLMACLIALSSLANPACRRALDISRRAKLIAIPTLILCTCFFLSVAVLPVIHSAISISRSNTALSQGRPDQAHAHLFEAARRDRLTDAAWYRNGRMYLHQYDQAPENTQLLKQAKTCFTEALSCNPRNFKNYEKLSDTLTHLGAYEEAHQAASRAIELYPGYARLHFKWARLSERLSRMDQAIAGYEQAVFIENKFRVQFQSMYPDRQDLVYRLNLADYEQAQQRLTDLKNSTDRRLDP